MPAITPDAPPVSPVPTPDPSQPPSPPVSAPSPVPVKKKPSRKKPSTRLSTLELTDADLQSRLRPVLDALGKSGRSFLQSNGISALLDEINTAIPESNASEKDRVWGILCACARSSSFRVTGSRIYFK